MWDDVEIMTWETKNGSLILYTFPMWRKDTRLNTGYGWTRMWDDVMGEKRHFSWILDTSLPGPEADPPSMLSAGMMEAGLSRLWKEQIK